MQDSIDSLSGDIKFMQRMMNGNATQLLPFDGQGDTIADFLEDFDRFVRATGRTSNQDKLDCLVANLAGPVKSWFRFQPEEIKTNYAHLRQQLTVTYQLCDHSKHLARSALFQMSQGPFQSVPEFVHTVQEKSRGLNMAEKDLLSIILAGARPEVRKYLAIDRPESIGDVLKSPAAQPTFSTEHQPSVMTFQDEIRALREQVTKLTLQNSIPRVAVADTPVSSTPKVRFEDQACQKCGKPDHCQGDSLSRKSRFDSRDRGHEDSRNRGRFNSGGRYDSRDQGRYESRGRGDSRERGRYETRGHSDSRDRGRYDSRGRGDSRERGRYDSRGRGDSRDRVRYTNSDNSNRNQQYPRQNSKCQGCAKDNCQGGTTCFAFNKQCNFCGILHHIKPACRKLKRLRDNNPSNTRK